MVKACDFVTILLMQLPPLDLLSCNPLKGVFYRHILSMKNLLCDYKWTCFLLFILFLSIIVIVEKSLQSVKNNYNFLKCNPRSAWLFFNLNLFDCAQIMC